MLVFFQNISNGFNNQLVLIDLVADAIYMTSIILHFRTAYYHHGELRAHSSDIFFNYLTGSFIIDAISMLSLIGRFSNFSYLNYLLLFTLLRLYQVPSLIASIEDYFQFSRQVKSTVEVIKLCFVIFILAHWLGCILFAITKIEDYEDTWLVGVSGIEENNLTDYYVASLYWALMTMSTVGYGDITPKSTKERILTIAVMILSSVVFGFLLSSIGSLLMEISAYSSEARLLLMQKKF